MIPALIQDSRRQHPSGHRHLRQSVRQGRPSGDELSGLKFIVCGAEKVRDETHNLIADRFGPVPVLEGYGATEASPVIAVNKPEDNRRGTVGGLLPGMETRSCRSTASAAAGASTCAVRTSWPAI